MDLQEPQRFLIGEDADVLEHFYFEFETVVFQTENLALTLETEPDNLTLVDDLIHNIRKLNSLALNTNVIPLIEPFTVLEKFITQVRTSYRPEISYPLMLVLDRVLLAAKEAVDQYSISMQLITDIQRAIQPLAHVNSPDDVERTIQQVIGLLLGDYVEKELTPDTDQVELFDGIDLFDEGDDTATQNKVQENKQNEITTVEEAGVGSNEFPSEQQAKFSDIDVLQLEMKILSTPSAFQKLSELIDSRQKYWVGRSYFMLSLGLKMNAMVGNIVDPQDLADAIYLHDFPMVSSSDEILYGTNLTDEEFNKIKRHPIMAHELAKSFGASEDCQNMVHQHHERPDGKGYPQQLSGDEICHGAKIIAICDAYYSMTNPKAHRATKRSALRTVAEINACSGSQFDSAWVKVFNLVVKRHKMLENI